jgi:hypothetical protein
MKESDKIVATRSFQTASGETVVASLYQPTQEKSGDWACAFEITGLASPIVDRAMGVDSLQALMIGIDGIRARLRETGVSLSWVGGEPDDVGIPRQISIAFGLSFQRRIEQLMDDEVDRMVQAKRRK